MSPHFSEWSSNMNEHCCEKKLRLLSAYRNAAKLYSAGVALMAEIAGGLLPQHEFALLVKAESLAHQKCLDHRELFFKHMQEHGC
jgi:hypothetical protein